eukprot:11185498-Lingulodinium_polyedra.AAC.1
MGARVAHPHRRRHMEAAGPHPCGTSNPAGATPGRNGGTSRAMEHLLRLGHGLPQPGRAPARGGWARHGK